nr:hypothetical protein [Tanacetum cinerariifolium]
MRSSPDYNQQPLNSFEWRKTIFGMVTNMGIHHAKPYTLLGGPLTKLEQRSDSQTHVLHLHQGLPAKIEIVLHNPKNHPLNLGTLPQSLVFVLSLIPSYFYTYKEMVRALRYPKEIMVYSFYYPPENKVIVAWNFKFFKNSLISQEASGSLEELKVT